MTQGFNCKPLNVLFTHSKNSGVFSPLLSKAAAVVRVQPHRLPHRAGGRPGHHRHAEDPGRPARIAPPAGSLRGWLHRRRQRVSVLCQEVSVKLQKTCVCVCVCEGDMVMLGSLQTKSYYYITGYRITSINISLMIVLKITATSVQLCNITKKC